MKGKFTAVFLGFLFSAALAYGSPVLTNGDFETGSISPWNNEWTITSTGCYAGNYCATSDGNVTLEQDFSGVDTDTISSVSFMLSSAGGLNAYDFLYAGGDFDEFVAFVPTTGYTLVDATSHLRSNDTLVGFRIYGNSGGVSTVDNVEIGGSGLSATPEPGSIMLLGTGLLSVMGVARKRMFA